MTDPMAYRLGERGVPEHLPDLERVVASMGKAWKNEIAQHTAFQTRLQSGETIAACLTDLDVLKQLYRQLSATEQSVLKEILKSYLSHPFREEEAVRTLAKAHLAIPYVRLALITLRQKGVLFALNNRWGETVLFLPKESAPLWHRICLGTAEAEDTLQAESSDGVTDQTEVPAAVPDHGLFEKLYPFLLYVFKHRLKTTKDGEIFKRQAMQMHKEFLEPDRKTEEWSLIRLLFAIAAREGLIWRATAREWSVDLMRVRQFFDRPRLCIEQRLYKRYKELVLASSEENPFFPPVKNRLLEHALYWLEGLSPHRWHHVRDFERWLDRNAFFLKDGWKKEVRAEVDRWLEQVCAMGWLERNEETGEFRWLWPAFSIQHSERPLYVQPNLEIIVSPETSPLERWEVELMAERLTGGAISRYMLTRQSLSVAGERWSDADELCAWLESRSKYGLPDNVRHTVHSWWSKRPQSSKPVANQNERDKQVEKVHQVEIDKQAENDFRNWRIDPRFPSVEQLYPGLRQIPQAWYNKLACYHASTIKSILDQAKKWEVPVYVQTKLKEWVLIPEQLDEKLDWSVTGTDLEGQKLKLRGKEIEKVHLILPGITDEKRNIDKI